MLYGRLFMVTTLRSLDMKASLVGFVAKSTGGMLLSSEEGSDRLEETIRAWNALHGVCRMGEKSYSLRRASWGNPYGDGKQKGRVLTKDPVLLVACDLRVGFQDGTSTRGG